LTVAVVSNDWRIGLITGMVDEQSAKQQTTYNGIIIKGGL